MDVLIEVLPMSAPCRLFDNSFINQYYYMRRLRCDLPLVQTTSNQTLHFLASSAVHLPSVMLVVILMNGYCVNLDLPFLSEEEAQQVQEKMDALRIRCSVLSLSSLDVLQRLEQALEASSRCTSSQEDLHLWLGRIERELLGAAGAQTHAGDAVLCAAERQRVMFTHN